MRVLIGTTNPSKVKRFETMLDGRNVEFLTLRDLGITEEPRETGTTPEENARLKAAFYGRYFDRVICNDSGLYFDELPLDDPRQPGLKVRSPEGTRLNDEEMIDYYSRLVHSLGGRVTAYYLDGIAVCKDGKITSFMETGEVVRTGMFDMVETPSPLRHEGWPLDSLSVHRDSQTFFVDGGSRPAPSEENVILGAYRTRLTEFLVCSLGIG
ncbi:MAG: non-canonical purine NTP pyrophosphatase [Eubacteriales bacterium]